MSDTIDLAASAAPWNNGDQWNDAFIYGEPSAAFDELMAQPSEMIVGKFFDGPGNSTKNFGWKSKSMTWGARAEKYFTHHPVGTQKDGECFVLGTSANGERKKESMRVMSAVGLDLDGADDLDTVVNAVEDFGHACFLYTSFRHGTTTLDLALKDVTKFAGDAAITDELVREYLRDRQPERGEEFICAVTIQDPRHDSGKGFVVRCGTPPTHKMRLLFPLSRPINLTDLDARNPSAGLEIWRSKIKGLADALNVSHDRACEDACRLYYSGRHPVDAADWHCGVFRGAPLAFGDIPEITDEPNARGKQKGAPQVTVTTPDGEVNVTALYHDFAQRWRLAHLMSLTPEYHRDGDGEGKVIVRCPFHAEHTDTDDDEATFVVDAEDSANGFAVIRCEHSCKDRYHTVDYLGRWLADGVIKVSDLRKSAYMAPLPDQGPAYYSQLADDEKVKPVDLLTDATKLTKDSSETEIRALFLKAIDGGADKTAISNLISELAKTTALGKIDLKTIAKEIAAEKAPKVKASKGAMLIDEDFAARNVFVAKSIQESNVFYQYMAQYAAIDAARARIRVLDFGPFNTELAKVAPFEKITGGEKNPAKVGVAPPRDSVEFAFHDLSLIDGLDEVLAVKNTPFLSASGSLVNEYGYHAEARTFLVPGLVVEGVSPCPSDAEVEKAKRFLVENILADFPLGGCKSRDELLAGAFDGEGVPAVAHALALMLQPFVRAMIAGATPAYLLDKKAAGTGATLLANLLSIIANGEEAAALALPRNKDELEKTLMAALMKGGDRLFFDNVNHEVDSGSLAAAITAKKYTGRVLGGSRMAEIEVQAAWIFTANSLSMTWELLRRSALVDMDAGLVDPSQRSGFRHADIVGWTKANRGQLVHSCLVLIANAIAKGLDEYSGPMLASFESWSRVMGGILHHAGIPGFLGNREELKEMTGGKESGLQEVVQEIAAAMYKANATKLYVRSIGRADARPDRIGLLDILNGMEDIPRLPGWGWKDTPNGVEYLDKASVERHFRGEVNKPYPVILSRKDGTLWEANVTFSKLKDRDKTNYYTMNIAWVSQLESEPESNVVKLAA